MDITEEHIDGVTILTELGTKPRVLRPTDLLKRINSELRTVRVLRKEELTLQGIKELNNYQSNFALPRLLRFWRE